MSKTDFRVVISKIIDIVWSILNGKIPEKVRENTKIFEVDFVNLENTKNSL